MFRKLGMKIAKPVPGGISEAPETKAKEEEKKTNVVSLNKPVKKEKSRGGC